MIKVIFTNKHHTQIEAYGYKFNIVHSESKVFGEEIHVGIWRGDTSVIDQDKPLAIVEYTPNPL